MTAGATRPTLGRRWRRLVLRVQGGLDGASADRFVPWAFAAATFAVLVALDAAAERSLEGGSGLGPWLQAAWARQHGGATPIGGVDPARAAWAFLAEPVLLLARLVPAEAAFTVVQAGAIAITIVPLWRLARDEAHLRVGTSSVVVLTFVLAPALQRTNLTAFHPEVMALPLLVWAYLCALRAQWWRYGVLVALVLLCGAALGVTVAGLGLVLALSGRRRPGWITAGAGLAWPALAVAVANPQLPSGQLTPAGEFATRATAPLALLPRLFTDPLETGRQLLSEPAVLFLVLVLAPLLFLPMVAPRRLAGALPCLALAMVVDTRVQDAAQRGVVNLAPAGAHIAPALAFVFIALVYALNRLGTRSVTRVNVDRRVLIALVVGATLFFVTEAPTSPYRKPWQWGSQDAADGARLEAADLIGPDDSVAVSPGSTALVSERASVVELPLDASNLTAVTLSGPVVRARWVLLDTRGADSQSGRPYWRRSDPRRVVALLERDRFEVVYAAEGIYLLRRTG